MASTLPGRQSIQFTSRRRPGTCWSSIVPTRTGISRVAVCVITVACATHSGLPRPFADKKTTTASAVSTGAAGGRTVTPAPDRSPAS